MNGVSGGLGPFWLACSVLVLLGLSPAASQQRESMFGQAKVCRAGIEREFEQETMLEILKSWSKPEVEVQAGAVASWSALHLRVIDAHAGETVTDEALALNRLSAQPALELAGTRCLFVLESGVIEPMLREAPELGPALHALYARAFSEQLRMPGRSWLAQVSSHRMRELARAHALRRVPDGMSRSELRQQAARMAAADALALSGSGQFELLEQGYESIQSAAALDRQNPEAAFLEGFFHERMEDPRGAIDAFRHALKLTARDADGASEHELRLRLAINQARDRYAGAARKSLLGLAEDQGAPVWVRSLSFQEAARLLPVRSRLELYRKAVRELPSDTGLGLLLRVELVLAGRPLEEERQSGARETVENPRVRYERLADERIERVEAAMLADLEPSRRALAAYLEGLERSNPDFYRP